MIFCGALFVGESRLPQAQKVDIILNPLVNILIFGYNVSCKTVFTGRRVHKLCQQGRIPGLERFGRSWVIPENAKKPTDPRMQKKRGVS